MTDQKKIMPDEHQFTLAAAADLLSEYGYVSVANVVGRISDQEVTLQFGGDHVTRQPFMVVEFDKLVETAKRIVNASENNVQVSRAVTDLLAAFRPDERDRIAAYLRS